LFIFEGQRTAKLWSDPLGRRWDMFGTADLALSYSLALFPALIAVMQAGAVVTGHIVGIVAAHDRALAVSPPTKAILGQTPMVTVMIGYTLAGLLLLFSQ
jgi:hypothetical protein